MFKAVFGSAAGFERRKSPKAAQMSIPSVVGLAAVKERSAVEFAERLPMDAPILLIHGTSDWGVSPPDCATPAAISFNFSCSTSDCA